MSKILCTIHKTNASQLSQVYICTVEPRYKEVGYNKTLL